jgi:DNA-binding transcriptional regulator YiaG
MNAADVKATRQRAGLTQAGLAALLGLADRRTVRRWEQGEIPVTGPAAIVLAMLDAGELPARYLDAEKIFAASKTLD